MPRRLRFALLGLVALGTLAFPAATSAEHGSADQASPNLVHLANRGSTGAIHSDLAFWKGGAIRGPHHDIVVAGDYDGFRIFDIKDPANPVLVSRFRCRGPQNDPSIYQAKNRLLLILSIDRPQTTAECPTSADTPLSLSGPFPPGSFGRAFQFGFEGLRIFDITNPAAPVHIASVPTSCGSHTHTTIPDKDNQRAIIYVSSYPLFGGATPPDTPPDAGPFCTPPHTKISIVEIPDAAPETARVLKEQPLHPDTLPYLGSIQEGGTGVQACHDIVAFFDSNMQSESNPKPKSEVAGGACVSEGQLWDISDPENPTTLTTHTHIRNPVIDFWHTGQFTWDGEILLMNDESDLGECPGPQGLKGNIWFYKAVPPGTPTAPLLGRYMIPRPQAGEIYCSSHLYTVIPKRGPRDERHLAVSSWYEGGVSVFDFTNPAAPVEIGFFDPTGVDGRGQTDIWTAYWYNDFIWGNDIERGFDVYAFCGLEPCQVRKGDPVPVNLFRARKFHHMNAQTQEPSQTLGP
jgi:hypothetical protein